MNKLTFNTNSYGSDDPPLLGTAIGFEDDDKISWLAREISELKLFEIKELEILLRDEYNIEIIIAIKRKNK